MNKIPVGQTIRFAYAFTFGEIGTIIGLIWIPTVINAVASYFAVDAYYRTIVVSLENGVLPVGTELGLPIVVGFVGMLLVAMIGVAVTQQALGVRQGPAFVHFSLGVTELRVFGGFFGLYLLFMLFMLFTLVLVSLVGAVFAGGVAASGGSAAALANSGASGLIAVGVGVATLVGTFIVLFLVVRLSFLMIPSIVSGGEFGLTRSWQLTTGNFWRIVGVSLATLLPIVLIVAVAELAILGSAFFTPDLQPATETAAILHRMAGKMRETQAHLPMMMGLSFVISPLMYGLMFSASAFAYRALTEPHSRATRHMRKAGDGE